MGLGRSQSKARGREVSCVIVTPLIETLLSQGLDPEPFAHTAGTTVARLQNRRDRISWAAFNLLMSALTEIWTPPALSDIGARSVRSLGRVPASIVARRILGPADLYALIGHSLVRRKRWLVSCIDQRAWEVLPTHIVVELTVDDGYELCPGLYHLTHGFLKAIPTLIDLPEASVEVEVVDRGALFHIRLAPHASLVSTGRRFNRNLRTVRVAIDELQAAHDLLNAQYEKLRKAQATLLDSEARFRALIENSSDCILLTNAEGRITYASPSAERVTGHVASQLVGSNHRDLPHRDERPAISAILDELGAAPCRTATLRFRLKSSRHSWVWLEGTAKNMLNDPHVQAIVVSYRDVTDRVRLEEQLLQSRKLESIGRLAGGIAHDFNNLLTGVLGNAQLALMHPEQPEATRERLEHIADYARRAADLTGQLLTFARKQVVNPRVVNLNQLIDQTRSLLGRLIGEQIEIVTVLEPGLGTVKVDPSRFQQVIVNLAINARDAMPGGGTLTITTLNVSSPESLPQVVFSVSDTGEGMDADTLANVFEPFFTTKEIGRGTGLGLATCHGIVNQAGGRIEVSSSLNAGSTFLVYLPRVDAAPLVEPSESKGSDDPCGIETILLVDDEPAVRQSAAELLRSLCYTVLVAEDGADALRIANAYAGEIHCVITDVVMPKLRGPELVKHLLRMRPGIRVMYISGYSEPGMSDAESPPVPLLVKPFDRAQLSILLRDVLGSLPSDREMHLRDAQSAPRTRGSE